MPVYIGDCLANTMHLSTEQHGGYLLLLFHLWRRGILPDDDVVPAQITGLSISAWSTARAVLGEFFEIRDGLWHHERVEQERSRVAAKQTSNSNKAKLAAYGRWGKPGPLSETRDEAGDAYITRSSNASGTAPAMPDDAKPDSEPELLRALPSSGRARQKRAADARHTPFRAILAEYWSYKNHASPEMPWQGRDAKALSDFLAASPNLSDAQFRQMLRNRAKPAVAHGDRVYLWIGNLTRFQEEITIYNEPASAEDSDASRAEINRNSVVSAVDRTLAMSRVLAEPGADKGTCRMVGGDQGWGRTAMGLPMERHGVEGRARGGGVKFGEDETERRVLLETEAVVAAPDIPADIEHTLKLLGGGSAKQGFSYVSQHPFVKGWGDFAGDAGSRTAERIESQWIRCYRQAVRKTRQTQAGGEPWRMLPARIRHLLRTRELASIIPRYGGRSEEQNADCARADLLHGDDLSVIKRTCVNTKGAQLRRRDRLGGDQRLPQHG